MKLSLKQLNKECGIMKKLVIFLVSGAVIVALAALLFAQNPQTAPQQQATANSALFDTCPWHNGNANTMSRHNMMGRGMMGSQMMVDDCGMMYSGRMNPRMMRNNPNSNAIFCPWDSAEFDAWRQSNKISAPLNRETARQWAEYYVNAYNNPDLVLGKITEKNNGFEIEVRSKKSNKVLEKILVDKQTGWISPVQNQ